MQEVLNINREVSSYRSKQYMGRNLKLYYTTLYQRSNGLTLQLLSNGKCESSDRETRTNDIREAHRAETISDSTEMPVFKSISQTLLSFVYSTGRSQQRTAGRTT